MAVARGPGAETEAFLPAARPLRGHLAAAVEAAGEGAAAAIDRTNVKDQDLPAAAGRDHLLAGAEATETEDLPAVAGHDHLPAAEAVDLPAAVAVGHNPILEAPAGRQNHNRDRDRHLRRPEQKTTAGIAKIAAPPVHRLDEALERKD